MSPLTLTAALQLRAGFQKPRRVLINHNWPCSLLEFITAFSLIIPKSVLRVKSKTWPMAIYICMSGCMCRWYAIEKKNLINDTHLSVPWLSKCKQRTQLFACSVISQCWQVFSLSLYSVSLSVSLLVLSTEQICTMLSTSQIASTRRKVKIYIKYSYLLTHTLHQMGFSLLFCSPALLFTLSSLAFLFLTQTAAVIDSHTEARRHAWLSAYTRTNSHKHSSLLSR